MATETKMNPVVKKNWLHWLRSGQYSQTKGVLCKETKTGKCSFCCLGVLSNIHAEETGGHWTEAEVQKGAVWKGILVYGKRDTMPSRIVTDWSGLSVGAQNQVANMNDHGDRFSKIANYIEKNL